MSTLTISLLIVLVVWMCDFVCEHNTTDSPKAIRSAICPLKRPSTELEGTVTTPVSR